MKAAAFQAQLDADRVTALEIVRNRELASWLASSHQDLQDLEFVDRIRLDTYLMGFLRSRQHEFINAEEGVIRQDLLASHEVILRGLVLTPAGRDIWHRNKRQLAPEFVKHVDEMLSGASDCRASGAGGRAFIAISWPYRSAP